MNKVTEPCKKYSMPFVLTLWSSLKENKRLKSRKIILYAIRRGVKVELMLKSPLLQNKAVSIRLTERAFRPRYKVCPKSENFFKEILIYPKSIYYPPRSISGASAQSHGYPSRPKRSAPTHLSRIYSHVLRRNYRFPSFKQKKLPFKWRGWTTLTTLDIHFRPLCRTSAFPFSNRGWAHGPLILKAKSETAFDEEDELTLESVVSSQIKRRHPKTVKLYSWATSFQ